MTLWQKWIGSNPVFHYHLLRQTKLLARRPVWQVLLITISFLALYLWVLYQAYQNGFPVLVIVLECLVLWLVAPLMTYSLFASEFEKATWDTLVLTRLTASQIVMGKFLSRLLISLFIAVLFLPLLWVGALREWEGTPVLKIFAWMLKTELVIVGWTILLIAVTLWLSYWIKRSMVAAAVTFAGQVFVLFILPTLWVLFLATFHLYPSLHSSKFGATIMYSEYDFYLWMIDPSAVLSYNPVIAVAGLYTLFEEAIPNQPWLWGTWQGMFYLLLSVVIVALLTRAVAKVTRKPM